MDRVSFLQEMLELTRAQALVIESMIEDVPDGKLIDFGRFVMERYEPKKSKLLIVKEAIFDFRRLQIESGLRSGRFAFSTIDEMVDFLKKHYRGREIVNGPASYFDHVVIAMDSDGRLINKYAIDEYGRYRVLDGESTLEVYRWLFENQRRIGRVEMCIPPKQSALPHEKVFEEKAIDGRVARMIGKALAKEEARWYGKEKA